MRRGGEEEVGVEYREARGRAEWRRQKCGLAKTISAAYEDMHFVVCIKLLLLFAMRRGGRRGESFLWWRTVTEEAWIWCFPGGHTPPRQTPNH